MSSNSAKNIIELRQLLAEKFPGVRMTAGRPETLVKRWPTGIPQLDLQLEGGLARGALTEIVSRGVRCGSALLLTEILRQSNHEGQWMALVDGADSFDPAGMENDELSNLLWVRCTSVKSAIKSVDLLLHDGTIPLVILDLIGCDKLQLRRIPASTWHRLARTVESTATASLLLTPEPMVSTAETRLVLQPRFTLASLSEDRNVLAAQLAVTPAGNEAKDKVELKRFGAAG